MNLDKAILAGNLTRSPELRFIPNGTAVANFGMATNRAWVDDRGERQEEWNSTTSWSLASKPKPRPST